MYTGLDAAHAALKAAVEEADAARDSGVARFNVELDTGAAEGVGEGHEGGPDRDGAGREKAGGRSESTDWRQVGNGLGGLRCLHLTAFVPQLVAVCC